jgi:hypothetical protein
MQYMLFIFYINEVGTGEHHGRDAEFHALKNSDVQKH